jgi:hypothetical protein
MSSILLVLVRPLGFRSLSINWHASSLVAVLEDTCYKKTQSMNRQVQSDLMTTARRLSACCCR